MADHRDEAPAIDALDRYWDALLDGAPDPPTDRPTSTRTSRPRCGMSTRCRTRRAPIRRSSRAWRRT